MHCKSHSSHRGHRAPGDCTPNPSGNLRLIPACLKASPDFEHILTINITNPSQHFSGRVTILRFTDTRNSGDKNSDRTIELKVQESGKMIDHLLKSTGYTKQKDSYEKGSPYAASKTVCTLSSRGKYKILSFSKIKNSAKQD